jgi:tetratricopeptide (TPR) repeat protein
MDLDQALILYDQRQYGLAMQELRIGLALRPRDGFAHAMIALCLSMQRQWERAREHGWKAVELAPDLGISYYALARARAGQIRYVEVPLLGRRWRDPEELDQVRITIQKAISLNPGNPDFFALQAELDLVQERWGDGLAASDQGLVVDPQHAECAGHRATALLHLGRRTDALGSLRRAVAMTPADDPAVCVRGWRALGEGRTDEALALFLDGLRADPKAEWLQVGVLEVIRTRHPRLQGLVGWKLRAALWRGRRRWRCWLVAGAGAVYWLAFAALTLALRGKPGYDLLVIRGVLAYSATCGVGVATVLLISAGDFLALRWLRLRAGTLRTASRGSPAYFP